MKTETAAGDRRVSTTRPVSAANGDDLRVVRVALRRSWGILVRRFLRRTKRLNSRAGNGAVEAAAVVDERNGPLAHSGLENATRFPQLPQPKPTVFQRRQWRTYNPSRPHLRPAPFWSEEWGPPHWILFEAGALSKSVKRGCIIPYLVDLEPDELPGPLRQFQAVRADEDGTLRLVRRLYELDPQNQPPPEFLDHLFRHTIWPTVTAVLPDAQPAEGAGPHNKELKLMKPSIMELRSS